MIYRLVHHIRSSGMPLASRVHAVTQLPLDPPRRLASSMPQERSAAALSSTDWSASQYLKFGQQRTRAVHDLVAQLPISCPARIIDLGCGPGNSTSVLKARFPGATVSGVDSSPDMLSRARQTLPDVQFELFDLTTYEPEPGADLLFSNAVFHWLRRHERIPVIVRLLKTQKPGGVFAFQVPDNYDEPSHRAMRQTVEDGPWKACFDALTDRPDLDPIEPVSDLYDALIPYCEKVDIWHTLYQHVLPGPGDIVGWVKGTGLQPFVQAVPEGTLRDGYLKAYEQRLAGLYPKLADGKIMLRYPRLFVVAVRK